MMSTKLYKVEEYLTSIECFTGGVTGHQHGVQGKHFKGHVKAKQGRFTAH